MFVIEKVVNSKMAEICDQMLTKLIKYESDFDDNIRKDFIVNSYYSKIYQEPNNSLFIAYINNKPVGYIYGFSTEKELLYYNKEATIQSLYVEDDYRRKGIGMALLNEFQNHCKTNGIPIIKLNVYYKNKEAFNLYTDYGFKCEMQYLKKEIDL